MRPAPPSRLLLTFAVLLCAMLAGAVGLRYPDPSHAATRATPGMTVHYGAGWNIVAEPTGTNLVAAVGPLFAVSPAVDGYISEAHDEVLGGRAVMAYFAQGVDVALGSTAAPRMPVRRTIAADPGCATRHAGRPPARRRPLPAHLPLSPGAVLDALQG